MTFSRLAAATVAAALMSPAGAQAATITVQGRCFPSGQPVAVVGAGFTPGASVSISGGAFGSTTSDAAGGFVTQVTAPFNRSTAPKTIQITAEEFNNPAATASTSFPVVRDAFYVDANLNGNPRSVVRWRFAGFPTGKPVYGHFRFGGRTMRNYRFGVAKGPCGTLTARARRLPVRKMRYGVWKMKFDTAMSYSAKRAGRLGELRVFRTFR